MNSFYATRIKSLVFTILATCSFQAVNGQEVIYSKGLVEIATQSGESFVILKNNNLQYGNVVRTGANGLAIISFPEGSKIKVDPSSEIVIGEREKAGDSADASWSLKVLKGALTIDFKKSSDEEKLYVESETFAVGVRGTRFLVAKESDDDWHIAVNEGKVTAFNKKNYDYEDINVGEAAVLEKGSQLTKPANYEWTKKIDWNVSKSGRASNFFSKEIRTRRRAEVKSRLKKLRVRKKKELKGKLRNTLKERRARAKIKSRTGIQDRIQKKMNRQRDSRLNRDSQNKIRERMNSRNKVKRDKRKASPQDFRERMKKKKVLRRRRN